MGEWRIKGIERKRKRRNETERNQKRGKISNMIKKKIDKNRLHNT